MSRQIQSRPLPFVHHDPDRVREEIACIENRLVEIGPDGDCGYENAMIQFLEKEMHRRRNWLLQQVVAQGAD